MNRNEYMKRVLPVISVLGEEKTDMIMDKIAAYLVDAGEDNEAAALNALGVPEIFARKFVHTDGSYEITPFKSNTHNNNDLSSEQQPGLFTQSEKMAMKPRAAENKSEVKDSKSNKAAGHDSKRMIILLSLLIITSPVWLCFMALFALLALVYAFAVASVLLAMTVGGATLTVFGVIRMFSIMPVGILMTGAGLLLLGLSGIAFLPLLKYSVRLLCGTVKDIVIFIKNAIRNAGGADSEVRA